MYDLSSTAIEKRKARQLPEPKGYRILVAMPEIKSETDGGILRAPEYTAREQQASNLAFVIKLGPDCYSDSTRFPNGPWCKEGDWVLIRSYAGTRLTIHGKDFRLINDDTVEAVIEDPTGYQRAI